MTHHATATQEDEQLLKCRWVRQTIHAELDLFREQSATKSDGLPLDFEVDSGISTHRTPHPKHGQTHWLTPLPECCMHTSNM